MDGIKYERILGVGSDAGWGMMLFKNEELVNYLTALYVDKSVYEYVPYESEVERAFAKRLDEREDIKLFVKLPGWFETDTRVGGLQSRLGDPQGRRSGSGAVPGAREPRVPRTSSSCASSGPTRSAVGRNTSRP